MSKRKHYKAEPLACILTSKMADSTCPSCSYVCDVYILWTIRSAILKAATVLLLSALLLDVVAIVTNHWLVLPDGSGISVFDHEIPSASGEPASVPVVCPIIGTLSALMLLSANVLNVFLATRQFLLVMPAIIVFSFIAALMLMTVVVTWSIPHVTSAHDISWSFILATVAVVVDMAGCGLCVMEFLSRRERPRPLDPSVIIPLQQLSSSNSDSHLSSAASSTRASQTFDQSENLTESVGQSENLTVSVVFSGNLTESVGQSGNCSGLVRQLEDLTEDASQSEMCSESTSQSSVPVTESTIQINTCSECVS